MRMNAALRFGGDGRRFAPAAMDSFDLPAAIAAL